MAKFDRCGICDYSEADGSFYANEAPSTKKVRYISERLEYFCDDCYSSVAQTLAEMTRDDEDYQHHKLMEALKCS